MAYDLPPIVKASEQLLQAVSAAVGGFARKHRYGLGARMEECAREVCRMANRAARQPSRQQHWTEELVWAVDELKVELRLAKSAEALQGFAQFEALIRLTEDVGRQAGGWLRQQRQHPRGQNQEGRRGALGRAQTLSTRSASMGAHA